MQFTYAALLAISGLAIATPAEKIFQREDETPDCSCPDFVNGARSREHFVEGQEYLRGLGAVCGAPADDCSRVSCSNAAGVYLCSNNGEEVTDLDCGIIADYIDHIFDACQYDGQYSVDKACGTQANTDGWYVGVGTSDPWC